MIRSKSVNESGILIPLVKVECEDLERSLKSINAFSLFFLGLYSHSWTVYVRTTPFDFTETFREVTIVFLTLFVCFCGWFSLVVVPIGHFSCLETKHYRLTVAKTLEQYTFLL